VLSVAGVNADSECREYLKDLMAKALSDELDDLEIQVTPEPDNYYDVHAIRVDINGKKVGYIAREDQKAVREFVPPNDPTSAYITSWGVFDNTNVYCNIELNVID